MGSARQQMDSAPKTAVEAVPKNYFASACLWNTCMYKQPKAQGNTRRQDLVGSTGPVLLKDRWVCKYRIVWLAYHLGCHGEMLSGVAEALWWSGGSIATPSGSGQAALTWNSLDVAWLKVWQVSLGSHETLQLQNIQLKYVEAIACQALMIGDPDGCLEVEGIIQKSHGYGAKLSLCWRLPPTPWRCAEAAASHCTFEQWLFTEIKWEWQRPRQRT